MSNTTLLCKMWFLCGSYYILDTNCNAFFRASYALVTLETAYLFVNSTELSQEVKSHFGNEVRNLTTNNILQLN